MRLGFLTILILVTSSVRGQDYFAENKEEMQFFGVSYGAGTNKWSSIATNYKLWDQSSKKILDGSATLRANSHSELYGIEAFLPIKKFRFGFGFNFEVIALYELELNSNEATSVHGFTEIFRADKVFISLERPYKKTRNGKGEFFLGICPGLYSFSMIRSTSLFGETRTGKKMFLQLSNGFEYNVYNKLYANVRCLVDYKFFRNTTPEFDRSIRHNIYTFGLSFGLRLAFR